MNTFSTRDRLHQLVQRDRAGSWLGTSLVAVPGAAILLYTVVYLATTRRMPEYFEQWIPILGFVALGLILFVMAIRSAQVLLQPDARYAFLSDPRPCLRVEFKSSGGVRRVKKRVMILRRDHAPTLLFPVPVPIDAAFESQLVAELGPAS